MRTSGIDPILADGIVRKPVLYMERWSNVAYTGNIAFFVCFLCNDVFLVSAL